MKSNSKSVTTRDKDIELLKIACEEHDENIFMRDAYKSQKPDPNNNPAQDALERLLNGKY